MTQSLVPGHPRLPFSLWVRSVGRALLCFSLWDLEALGPGYGATWGGGSTPGF